MKNRKSNLDERQEQVLLQIESRGFWLAYILLLAAIIVQSIVTGFDLKAMAGEWITFFIMCVYLGAGCMKNGIWDRKLNPDPKYNLICSLVAGLVFGACMFLGVYLKFPDKPVGSIAAGVFSGLMVFVLCFVALSVAAARIKKVQKALEAEDPEEE